MKQYIKVAILTFLSYHLNGQNISTKFQRVNSVQLQLSGREDFLVPISAHYERIFYQNSKIAWSGALGGTYLPFKSRSQKSIVAESGFIGQGNKHHWEIFLVGMLQDKHTFNEPQDKLVSKAASWYSSVKLGYRYQPSDGVWIVRIGGMIPIIYESHNIDWSTSYKLRNILLPWPAISFGRSF